MKYFVIILVLLSFSKNLYGQASKVNYVSPVDDQLSIDSLLVLPSLDNVNGLYSRPLESHLKKLIDESHRFSLEPLRAAGNINSTDSLSQNPQLVLDLSKGSKAQAALSLGIFKSPKGFQLKIALFSTRDGSLLLQNEKREIKGFEIKKLEGEVEGLYRQLISSLPYDGKILSRQLTRVTVDLGQSDGIKSGDVIPVIQIIKLNRHPKFKFIVGTDKEIIGQIQITKVDKKLSFGQIISEKENGIIKKDNKIVAQRSVTYDKIGGGQKGFVKVGQKPLSDRKDAKIAFGEDPEEWKPQPPPTFGEVGAKFGFGSFSNKTQLASAGSVDAKSGIYPRINLFGEFWLTPEYIMRVDLTQGIIESDNPLSGSEPESLSQSMTKYSLQFGYTHNFTGDYFGPKIQALLGFAQSRVFVDDTNPRGLTTTTYSGAMLSIAGSTPLGFVPKWKAGARINFYLFPHLKEEPVSSGRDSNDTMTEFSLFTSYKWMERLHLIGSVDISLYTSSFTGGGTRSDDANNISQSDTSFNAGIKYLF